MTGKLISKYKPDNNKKFHIVAPTYNGGTKLEVFINSFLSQTCDNYHITIVSDGPEPDTVKQLSKYFDYPNFSYYSLEKRYNDFGHTPREFGLLQSNCKYTIMTGFDNYYVPIFIERFNEVDLKTSDAGFIFCDFVLDHIREGKRYNKYFNAEIKSSCIDIGCFATLTTIAKQIGFKFRSYAADWEFVEAAIPELKKQKLNILKIPQTLYIHN
jgi:glycosyltransferase involved in cell wall biosynthesis